MKQFFIVALFFSGTAYAQQQPATPAAPVTQLESFSAQSGVLTLRETLGTKLFNGQFSGDSQLELEGVRVSRPGTKLSAYGVVFTVANGKFEKRIYIDKDELPGLIDATSYIIKNAKALNSKLSPELTFISKAGLKITVLTSTSSGVNYAVTAGIYSIFLTADDITQIRDQLVAFQPLFK